MNHPTSIVGRMFHSSKYKEHEWIIVCKEVPAGIVTDRMRLNIVK